MVVIGAISAVAVVAAVVVVVAILQQYGKGTELGSGQSGSPQTSSSSTANTATTTTTTTTESKVTTSQAPPPNPSVAALREVLPTAYRGNSSCAEKENGGGAELATVACTEANSVNGYFPPPDRAVFRLFPDRAAQDAYFTKLVQENNIPRLDEQGGCRPTTQPTHYAALVRTEAGPLPGEFTTCFVKDGAGQLWWVDSKTLVIGQLVAAKATTPDALEDLDFWWNTMILTTMR
jgi:serine/threonine-protein kinase